MNGCHILFYHKLHKSFPPESCFFFLFFRGIGKGYTGGYHEYFGPDADIDSHIYLMLANDLIHSVVPLVHFGVILPVMSKEWCLKEWGTWMKLKLHLVWYKKWHLE